MCEMYSLTLQQLPFSPLKDGTSGPSSWKPVKDLVRFCMAQSSGDDPKVEIRDYCFKNFLPQAFVKLKKEGNARLVFGKINFLPFLMFSNAMYEIRG